MKLRNMVMAAGAVLASGFLASCSNDSSSGFSGLPVSGNTDTTVASVGSWVADQESKGVTYTISSLKVESDDSVLCATVDFGKQISFWENDSVNIFVVKDATRVPDPKSQTPVQGEWGAAASKVSVSGGTIIYQGYVFGKNEKSEGITTDANFAAGTESNNWLWKYPSTSMKITIPLSTLGISVDESVNVVVTTTSHWTDKDTGAESQNVMSVFPKSAVSKMEQTELALDFAKHGAPHKIGSDKPKNETPPPAEDKGILTATFDGFTLTAADTIKIEYGTGTKEEVSGTLSADGTSAAFEIKGALKNDDGWYEISKVEISNGTEVLIYNGENVNSWAEYKPAMTLTFKKKVADTDTWIKLVDAESKTAMSGLSELLASSVLENLSIKKIKVEYANMDGGDPWWFTLTSSARDWNANKIVTTYDSSISGYSAVIENSTIIDAYKANGLFGATDSSGTLTVSYVAN